MKSPKWPAQSLVDRVGWVESGCVSGLGDDWGPLTLVDLQGALGEIAPPGSRTV